jgi:hypothetical protein
MQVQGRYISVDGYPELELVVDGKIHLISPEQKPTLVRNGFFAWDGDTVGRLPGG